MRAAPPCQNDVFSMDCSAHECDTFPNPSRSAVARGHDYEPRERECPTSEMGGGRESTLLSRNLSMRTMEDGDKDGKERKRASPGMVLLQSAAGLRILGTGIYCNNWLLD